MGDTPKPMVRWTSCTISVLPEDNINFRHFSLIVERQGPDEWTVRNYSEFLGADGSWDALRQDSAWKRAHRFELEDAIERAKRAAPDFTVNGITAAEVLQRASLVKES